jgi:hypothetical protein
MITKTAPVVYMTPSSEAERAALSDILAPYSWAGGEFGIMLTDVAFEECLQSCAYNVEIGLRAVLDQALQNVRSVGACDVCLNFGLVN